MDPELPSLQVSRTENSAGQMAGGPQLQMGCFLQHFGQILRDQFTGPISYCGEESDLGPHPPNLVRSSTQGPHHLGVISKDPTLWRRHQAAKGVITPQRDGHQQIIPVTTSPSARLPSHPLQPSISLPSLTSLTSLGTPNSPTLIHSLGSCKSPKTQKGVRMLSNITLENSQTEPWTKEAGVEETR